MVSVHENLRLGQSVFQHYEYLYQNLGNVKVVSSITVKVIHSVMSLFPPLWEFQVRIGPQHCLWSLEAIKRIWWLELMTYNINHWNVWSYSIIDRKTS